MKIGRKDILGEKSRAIEIIGNCGEEVESEFYEKFAFLDAQWKDNFDTLR